MYLSYCGKKERVRQRDIRETQREDRRKGEREREREREREVIACAHSLCSIVWCCLITYGVLCLAAEVQTKIWNDSAVKGNSLCMFSFCMNIYIIIMLIPSRPASMGYNRATSSANLLLHRSLACYLLQRLFFMSLPPFYSFS